MEGMECNWEEDEEKRKNKISKEGEKTVAGEGKRREERGIGNQNQKQSFTLAKKNQIVI